MLSTPNFTKSQFNVIGRYRTTTYFSGLESTQAYLHIFAFQSVLPWSFVSFPGAFPTQTLPKVALSRASRRFLSTSSCYIMCQGIFALHKACNGRICHEGLSCVHREPLLE